ncbi:uracil-DNA glycosylase [uncultured Flavobacterium sp.]|uniref:uracil-DNA glycosylase n=1 Tax=uncultured Flavobacterium sp. TaxID=165435 RepID=UPI0030CA2680
MLMNISTSWQKKLKNEFDKDYFKELIVQVENEFRSSICYPPKEFIFNAFNSCSFDQVKVVIIGQDPYHGEGEANGLCFSVNDGVKIPPSLRHIFTEIYSDLNAIFLPNTGNLDRWSKQGVLLLNTTLTVRKDTPNSHKTLKWNLFTDAVIHLISEEKKGVVFLLWGAFAQKKGSKINKNKHQVFECGHPSFAHSHKKWFGNQHFSKTNTYLIKNGKKPIDWF